MENFYWPTQIGSDNYLPLIKGENSCSNFSPERRLSSYNFNPHNSPLLDVHNTGNYFNYSPKHNGTNASTPTPLSKAGKRRFQRLLKKGIPRDEAKILAQNPSSTGPSTSKRQQETSLFQNPNHIPNCGDPLSNFQEYVQFRMESEDLNPKNTQRPHRIPFSSLFFRPYYKPKKKKKKPKSVTKVDKLPPGEKQVKNVTPAQKKQSKSAKRKLRRQIKKSKMNKVANERPPVIENSKAVVEKQQISQTNESVETQVQISQVPAVTEKEIITEWKIGIIPEDYPHISFTQEQINSIQKEILAKVALQKTEKIKPRFKGVKIENGVMIIHCADEESAFWLKTTEHSLALQTEIKLKIVDKVPKISTLIGYFPDSREDSSEFILELISGQNEDLNVDDWKVVDRKEEEESSVLTVLVDEVSAEKIKLKESINYKFGFATFLLDSSPIQKGEENHGDTVTTNDNSAT